MAKLFQRKGRKNYYAHVKLWDAEKKAYAWEHVATRTSNEVEAQNFAEAMELASEQAKPLSGSSITKEHAENMLLSILARAGIEVEGNKDLPVVSDFFDAYNEGVKNKISPASHATYRSQLNKFKKWLPDNKRLDWLTVYELEKYYRWLLDHLAPKSAKEQVRYVGRVLNTAVPLYLASNPASYITFSKQTDSLERLPFSAKEVDDILAHLVKGKDDRSLEWRRAVMLAASVGCRLEDAVTMTRESLEGDTITYTQKKTGKRISCPIVNNEWLQHLQESETLFCAELNSEYLKNRTGNLSEEFTSIVNSSGVEQVYHTFAKSGQVVARKTFHSLRHTLRTAIVSSGGSDAQADLILGHSGNQGKTYTHSEADAMRATLKRALKKS